MLLALSETIIAVLISIDNLNPLSKALNGESIALFLSRIVFWIVIMLIKKIIVKERANILSRKVVVLEGIVFLTIISELLFLGMRKQDDIIIETVVLFAAEITVYLLSVRVMKTIMMQQTQLHSQSRNMKATSLSTVLAINLIH